MSVHHHRHTRPPPVFDETRLAVAGFLARYSVRPGSATAAICASSSPGAPRSTWPCSNSSEAIWSCGPDPWKNGAWPGPPSPGGYPPWPASTASVCSTGWSSTPAEHVRRPKMLPDDQTGNSPPTWPGRRLAPHVSGLPGHGIAAIQGDIGTGSA